VESEVFLSDPFSTLKNVEGCWKRFWTKSQAEHHLVGAVIKHSRPHVVILGAGPAGLGAAYQLVKRQLARVTVLEKGRKVGGNAGSFEVEGIYLDYGSHRFHPACDPVLLEDLKHLLGDDLLVRPRQGRIRLKNQWIRFPFHPLDLVSKLPPTFALGVVGDALAKALPHKGKDETFASILQGQLGRTICREFYFPYARKIWGMEPDQISGIQAQRRVSANSLTKLFKKMFSTVRKESPYFYYPKRGYGQISNAIYQAALNYGAQVILGAEVVEIQRKNNRVSAVIYECQSAQKTLPADRVWSTIPITTLLKSLRPKPEEALLRATARIRFRAMLLIYLVLEQDRFSEFDAHYFPEIDISITRLSEPKNYSNAKEPKGLTALCAELPCDVSDDVWAMTDAELGRIVIDALKTANIAVTVPVRRILVRRIPHAYPIYERGFEEHFKIADNYIEEIDRLLTFGRQGLFVHDNTHHALFVAYSAVDCLDEEGHFDNQKWREYRKIFNTHVVED